MTGCTIFQTLKASGVQSPPEIGGAEISVNITSGGLCIFLKLPAPSLAHHSFAAHYFEDQMISIEGELVEFEYRSPHAWVHVMAKDENGQVHRYSAEWASVDRLRRAGVVKDTLKPGDHVIISGLAAVHQFTRLGKHAFISGGAMVTMDIPPYATAQGDRAELVGLNTVGLERSGFTKEQMERIKEAHRILFRSKLGLQEAMARLRSPYRTRTLISTRSSATKQVRTFWTWARIGGRRCPAARTPARETTPAR